LTCFDACRICDHPLWPTDSGIDLKTNSPVHIVERLAEHIIVLEGWRRPMLAVGAGAMSTLALAPYHVFPVLFFTMPVLVWLLDGAVAASGSHGVVGRLKRSWPAFKTGWLFGFGYFLAGFWWVGQAFLVDVEEFAFLMPLAVLVLPAGLSLFWGIGAVLARMVWRDGWMRIVGFAACFTLAEWLRGTVLTGLPWNVLGYAAMPTPLLMQSAAVVGLYGMTFLTFFVASAPAVLGPCEDKHRRSGAMTVAVVFIVAAHVACGMFVLSRAEKSHVAGIKLRIVQPALDQQEKWDITKELEIMGRYFELSNANKGPDAASVAAFSHIIWPESAFPFILTERGDQLAAIARLLPDTTSLITGAMRIERAASADIPPKVFNALYMINGDGEAVVARDKVRLLPFGEFLPFQDFLESLGLLQLTQLRGGFSAGNRRMVVDIPGTPAFLPLICYEIIFSGAVRPRDKDNGARPRWIVNVTNDAWFGKTAGPYQHAHQALVRGVEEGLPVVRAANNGISFVSDAYGRIEESLGLGQRGVVDARLPVARSSTLFSRLGNLPVLVFVCLLIGSLLVFQRNSTIRL
jgi:apolipoprotein N-acyltransferase